MNYLNYTDYPSLPEDLFPEIYKSLGNKNRFPIENEQYKAFEATQPLKNFTNSIFNFEHNTAVQVLYKDVDIHVDLFRTIAYNYIIDTGGEDVSTCFYDEFHNVTKSYKIADNKWHSLKVNVKHNVINIVRPRIAITVHDISEIPLEFRW